MVENFVSDMWSNTQSSHPGHTGPAQIMKAPLSHSGELIKQALGSTEALEWPSSEH